MGEVRAPRHVAIFSLLPDPGDNDVHGHSLCDYLYYLFIYFS